VIGSDTEGPLDTLMVEAKTALIVVLEVETAAPEAIGNNTRPVIPIPIPIILGVVIFSTC
jgi:hypothetical protein